MAINENIEAQSVEFALNRGDVHYRPHRLGVQVIRRSKRVFKGCYDFAIQGGAIGSIALYDPGYGKAQPLNLPSNFIISNVLIDGITALTSGGSATVALTSGQTAADLLTATAYSSAPFSGSMLAGIPVSAATAIKVPATQAAPGSAVAMVIAVAALTGGQFNVHIEGFLSDLV